MPSAATCTATMTKPGIIGTILAVAIKIAKDGGEEWLGIITDCKLELATLADFKRWSFDSCPGFPYRPFHFIFSHAFLSTTVLNMSTLEKNASA